MDGRKHLLEPFQSLQNFRCIAALTEAQDTLSHLYAEAHPDLAQLSTIVDTILLNAECSTNEAIYACHEVLKAIDSDDNITPEQSFLVYAACNYTLAKLAVDKRKLHRASRALASTFCSLEKYNATQPALRQPWQAPHFEYLQYCAHRLQGVLFLLSNEFIKAARHFRLALGFCVPPYISSGAVILQSYLGMTHVHLGDVEAGFSMLSQVDRAFDQARRDTSLDWVTHRYNVGLAYQAVNAHEKALIEFETVLAMQTLLFHPDSAFIDLEIESLQCINDTHAAIITSATRVGDHVKAAQHLRALTTANQRDDISREDSDDENHLDAQAMDWSPLPNRFIIIPNPAFGLNVNLNEENEPDENHLDRRYGPPS